MSKRQLRYVDQPKYRYYISNPATWMKLSRDFHAKDNDAARAYVNRLRPCFGQATVIDKIVRLVKKQRDLFDDEDDD